MIKSIRYCDICNVSSETKIIKYCKDIQKYLCSKHYHQYLNYNKFFDTSPITIDDLNEISTDQYDQKISYLHLYNKYGEEIYISKIDTEDIEKIKNRRWRISKKRDKIYVASVEKNSIIYLSRYLLNYNEELEVDHINGDSLDNRKCNLRIIKREDNITNVCYKNNSKSKIRGVSYDSFNDVYITDFSYKNHRFYFKPFNKIEESVYLRFLCEKYFLKEYRYFSNDKRIYDCINKLNEKDKELISKYFYSKVKEYDNDN